MVPENIQTDIRRFIVDTFLFGEDNGIKAGDSLIERGIIDSTGVLELVHFLESTFSLEIDDSEIIPENLDSMERLAHFVTVKKAHA